MVGGFPAAGPLFGAAYNPEAVMPTSTMIDLIQGGNLDAAVLGCAEVVSLIQQVLSKPLCCGLRMLGQIKPSLRRNEIVCAFVKYKLCLGAV